MFTMDMYNGHFNNHDNRFIDLHYFGAFWQGRKYVYRIGNYRAGQKPANPDRYSSSETAPLCKILKQSDN